MGTRPGPAGGPDGGPRATDLIRRLGEVEGITAVEVNFTPHLSGHEVDEPAEVAAEVDLPVTSVNLSFPDDPFLNGPFDGVVYFDTSSTRGNPVEETSENVRRFAVMWEAAGRLTESDMAELMQERDAMGSQRVAFDAISSS